MDIYNEISGIHYSLMLKNMSLLVLLLFTKISCFIISPLVKLRYLNKQILIKDTFHVN